VRQLAAHFKTSPDQLSAAQLRDYLLFLKNDKQFAASTLRLAYSGIKFFYTRTVPRDWRILKSLRIPKPKTLPDVLSIAEVRRLIEATHRPPGGALSQDGSQWLASRSDFFLPVRALSVLFRAKFRDALKTAGLYHQVDPQVWRQDWVVHSRPAGDGRASLKYLAPYVFRVAISDRRIVSFDDQTVTFSYRKSGSNRWRQMTLSAMEFIRRFLQHVLPSGFQKVRHYGFLSANSRLSIEAVRRLVTLANGQLLVLLSQPQQTPICLPRVRCSRCGGLLRLSSVALPHRPCRFDTS